MHIYYKGTRWDFVYHCRYVLKLRRRTWGYCTGTIKRFPCCRRCKNSEFLSLTSSTKNGQRTTERYEKSIETDAQTVASAPRAAAPRHRYGSNRQVKLQCVENINKCCRLIFYLCLHVVVVMVDLTESQNASFPKRHGENGKTTQTITTHTHFVCS